MSSKAVLPTRRALQPTYRDRTGRIRLGDVIVAINDDPVTGSKDMVLILEKYKPGEQVKVKVLRNDKEAVVNLVLDEAR